MGTYIRYDRNGKTSQHRSVPTNLRLVYDSEAGKWIYESRSRYGKTARDRRNNAHQRSYDRKRARDSWRDQTRSVVYSDPQAVPAFPN